MGKSTVFSPTSVPSINPPTNKAPTKAPVHSFDTLAPTRAPTPALTTFAPSTANVTNIYSDEGSENYTVVIIIGAVGAVIVIFCCAILLYWHLYTRVEGGSGLLSVDFLSCCTSCFKGKGDGESRTDESISFRKL